MAFAVACGGNNDDNNDPKTNATTGNNPNSTNSTTPTDTTPTTAPDNIGTADCTAAGQSCDIGNEIRAGFECVDAVCRVSCASNADCQAGSVCGALTDGGPVHCVPSDCNGWLDTTSCDAGEQCAGFENETHLCVQAGTVPDGGACGEGAACAAGLICGPSGECTPLCDSSSSTCTGGESCVNDTVDRGIGFCALTCDAFSVGQCGDGLHCELLTLTQGICEEAEGDLPPFSACTPPTQAQIDNGTYVDECGESTACIAFDDGLGRCLPYCNGGLETAAERDATCLGGSDAGVELNVSCHLISSDPAAQVGFCFETCASTDFGTDKCFNEEDACTPLSFGNACFPSGTIPVGEACDPDASLLEGCDGGGSCRAIGGGGGGVCAAYCEAANPSNDNIGCGTGEVCVGDRDNIGNCEITCTPNDNWIDDSCPAGMKNCFADDLVTPGENAIVPPAYCRASGSGAIGSACELFAGDCAPGLECINDIAKGGPQDPVNPLGGGVCAQQCTPWAEESECGDNQVCALSIISLNRSVGFCTTVDQELGPLEDCGADTMICGSEATCLLFQGETVAMCVPFCDLDNPTETCDSSCDALFLSAEIRLGICN